MTTHPSFDRRLANVPSTWRGTIVEVIDTFETAQIGLKSIGVDDPFVLIEAVKLILDRYDKREDLFE
jgi:hypothetical protein